jgi:uncharacterized protein
VLAEASYLVRKALGASGEAALPRAASRGSSGSSCRSPQASSGWQSFVETYADLPLGTVDASIVATAERLGEASVATRDRRHFTVVRPAHVEAFTLLP